MLDGNFSMKTWFAQLEMNIQTTELTNSKKKKSFFPYIMFALHFSHLI